MKDAPGVVPSLEVFGALTSLATWADATRGDTNVFYDMGFEFVEEMSELELLLHIAIAAAALAAVGGAQSRKGLGTGAGRG